MRNKLVLIALVLFMYSSLFAYVTVGSGGNYPDIIAALGDPDSEIRVANNYVETNIVTINKNCSIVSYDPTWTTKTPGASSTRWFNVEGASTVATFEGFTVNNSDAEGGIRGYDTATINVVNCTLTGNYAGVQAYDAVIFNVSDSQLNNNRHGIVIEANPGAQVNVSNTDINNSIENGVGFWIQGTVNLQNCQINSNGRTGIATDGGATGSTIIVSNSTLDNNGPGIGWGDGVGLYRASTLTISNSTISNSFNYGIRVDWNDPGTSSDINLDIVTISSSGDSAISMNSNDPQPNRLRADRCSFIDESANDANPLLYIRFTDAILTNCIIDGGVIGAWLEINQTKFYHCTFVNSDNSGTVGIHVQWPPAGEPSLHGIFNSIINGYEIGFDNANAAFIDSDFNLINCVTNFGGTGEIVAGANDILSQNPLFVSNSTGPGTGDFHLQSTSPAIGVGTPLITNAKYDFDGISRPLPGGTLPDMGAYEEQTTFVAPLPLPDMILTADASNIIVDGSASDWIGLISESQSLHTYGRGNLTCDVTFAWYNYFLYILIKETPGDTTQQEASSGAAYASEPWNFDGVAFWFDFDNSNDSEQIAQDLNLWLGFSSSGLSGLTICRINNTDTLTPLPMQNGSTATSGSFSSNNRVIEASVKWSDIAATVESSRQPSGNIFIAIGPGYQFGCEPLLLDDDYNGQSFIGGSQFTIPCGVDMNSRDIILYGWVPSAENFELFQ